MGDTLNLRLTDEPPVPEGYMPVIQFYINEDMELYSAYKKELPIEAIIEALQQWIADGGTVIDNPPE